MESVKKSIDERAQHKRENNRRVNDRVMQSKEGNVDSSTALDAGLVVTESNETESERHVSSSRAGKDTHAEDADINSVNDKQDHYIGIIELFNIDTLANEQQHFVQSEPFIDIHAVGKVEPKNYKEALTQACWIEAMEEELHEFEHLEVWELVPPPDKAFVITLKWIYKVKLDELGGILKNKARLVARGYRKKRESILKSPSHPVAGLEAIRIFIAFTVSYET
ncbi:retrovirus-related pol polyprotein from transposon TNT 1-94 [Tanacetum coccineum]